MGKTRLNEQEHWCLMEDNRYAISDMGRVFSFKSMRCLRPHKRRDGYLSVSIAGKEILVHRAVAHGFLELPSGEKNQINHKNGEKHDNRVINLEWATPSQNVLHAYRVLGVEVSPERRLKIGKANKGRLALGKHFKAKRVMCLETGECFDCFKEAAIKYGISKSSVSHSVRSGCRAHGMFHFSEIKED